MKAGSWDELKYLLLTSELVCNCSLILWLHTVSILIHLNEPYGIHYSHTRVIGQMAVWLPLLVSLCIIYL